MRRIHRIWSENRVYFILYLLLLILGLAFITVNEKGTAVLWMNAHHSASMDVFFRFWTKLGEEWAFIIAGLAILFYQVRHALYIPLLGGMVSLVSYLLKTFFAHPRPARFFSDQGIYEALNKVELIPVAFGLTSFPSGHTMAAFGLYTYLAFVIKSRLIKVLLLFTAVLVGISRIYLLQHFLQDICLGSACGILIAILVYGIQDRFRSEGSKWGNSILHFKRHGA